MNKSESISNISKAIVSVMSEIKSIEKNSKVGTGGSSYKAVQDKDVKTSVRKAMINNGLSIIPTSIKSKSKYIEYKGEYNGKETRKKEIYTEAHTRYLLIHESGEYIEVAGYGQGIDSQDKGAGKATTYALKYALLYLFLIPTGQIADADDTKPEVKEDEVSKRIKDSIKKAKTIPILCKIEDQLTEKGFDTPEYLKLIEAAKIEIIEKNGIND